MKVHRFKKINGSITWNDKRDKKTQLYEMTILIQSPGENGPWASYRKAFRKYGELEDYMDQVKFWVEKVLNAEESVIDQFRFFNYGSAKPPGELQEDYIKKNYYNQRQLYQKLMGKPKWRY